MKTLAGLAIVCGLAIGGATPSLAAGFEMSSVSVGGVTAALLKPTSPRASLILLPGAKGYVNVLSDGDIGPGSFNLLVRTRKAYAARGFAVLVPNVGYNLSALISYMAQIKRPVVVVATSRGTQRAAEGMAAGAHPDKLVLISGFYAPDSGRGSNFMDTLGSPAALPKTLVVHHRQDSCRYTLPSAVPSFIAWSKGKARAVWLDGGSSSGDPCEAHAHHGFNGIDGQVVSTVSGFAGN